MIAWGFLHASTTIKIAIISKKFNLLKDDKAYVVDNC